ncbi:MAG TPA: DsbA family protein [Candidatus Binataceae bacterium]|nr:DsbA family protein [Candidatus Binataceae bacterium]
METAQVKMYSDYKSPFAYLAFDPAFALEERYHIRVCWIPFQLRIKGKGERSAYSEYKVKYSYLDARRWAKPRGIYLKGPKKIYDTTPALIGGLFANRHGRLLDYSRKIYERFFRGELEADQSASVAQIISELELSADEYMGYLKGDGVIDYANAQAEAADDHVFGVPLFYFNDEPFWGYDRIPMLEERLTESGLKRS